MVLESLFNPFVIKKRPWEMFLAGFIYSTVGLSLSYLVFREISGILSVFLIVMATLPILYTTIKNEEELDLKYDQEWKLLKEHTKVLVFLMFLFLGITAAFSLAYVVLPESVVTTTFSLQQQAIVNTNSNVQGNATSFTFFTKIFSQFNFNFSLFIIIHIHCTIYAFCTSSA